MYKAIGLSKQSCHQKYNEYCHKNSNPEMESWNKKLSVLLTLKSINWRAFLLKSVRFSISPASKCLLHIYTINILLVNLLRSERMCERKVAIYITAKTNVQNVKRKKNETKIIIYHWIWPLYVWRILYIW